MSSQYFSDVIGTGTSQSDTFRPELADAKNAVGDPYYTWTAQMPPIDEGTGLLLGSVAAVQAAKGPTTGEAEPEPILPGTERVYDSLMSVIETRDQPLSVVERARVLLNRRGFAAAFYILPSRDGAEVMRLVGESIEKGGFSAAFP